MSREIKNVYKDRNSKEKIAWISGICMIIAALISTISVSINVNIENDKLKKDYEELKLKNSNLQTQLNDMSNSYNDLNMENINLRNEILVLQNQIAENDSANDNVYIKVKFSATMVRSAPQINANIITSLSPGVILLVDDIVTASDGREWYQVLVEDKIGFIYSGLVEIIE